MARKLFIIFLLLWYLGVSSGISLHFQYCMGRLMNVAVWDTGSKKCPICGMQLKSKASRKCCKDQHQEFKLEKGSAPSHDGINFETSAAIFLNQPFYSATRCFPLTGKVYRANYAPPPKSAVPAFILHGNFRI